MVVAGAEVVVKVEVVLEIVDEKLVLETVDEKLVDVGLTGQVGSMMVTETCWTTLHTRGSRSVPSSTAACNSVGVMLRPITCWSATMIEAMLGLPDRIAGTRFKSSVKEHRSPPRRGHS